MFDIIEIIEPDFNAWDIISFDYHETETQNHWYRYLPRPFDGRDKAKGIAISFPLDENLWTWDNIYNGLLKTEKFVELVFGKYNMGLKAERHWYRILEWLVGWLQIPNAPQWEKKHMIYDQQLPEDYERFVRETLVKFGYEPKFHDDLIRSRKG